MSVEGIDRVIEVSAECTEPGCPVTLGDLIRLRMPRRSPKHDDHVKAASRSTARGDRDVVFSAADSSHRLGDEPKIVWAMWMCLSAVPRSTSGLHLTHMEACANRRAAEFDYVSGPEPLTVQQPPGRRGRRPVWRGTYQPNMLSIGRSLMRSQSRVENGDCVLAARSQLRCDRGCTPLLRPARSSPSF